MGNAILPCLLPLLPLGQCYFEERFCLPEVILVIFLGDPDCRLVHYFEQIVKAHISFCIVVRSVPAIKTNPLMIQNIMPNSFRTSPEASEAMLGGFAINLPLLCVHWRSGVGSSNVPARFFGAGPFLHISYR